MKAGARVVGVGPGDPELLTLRAAAVLDRCATVFHAGPRDDEGFAYEVVAERLRPDQTVRGMALSMRKGGDEAAAGYGRIAEAMAAEARSGRPCAYLTEGDPMLFGSGAIVAEHLKALAPEVPIEIVPGVSAFAAAAARLGWPLARKDEILTVCPATYHEADIGDLLDRGGASCWLKAASVLPALIDALRSRGRLSQAALVERLGRPDERIFLDLEAASRETLSYFSLVLIRST